MVLASDLSSYSAHTGELILFWDSYDATPDMKDPNYRNPRVWASSSSSKDYELVFLSPELASEDALPPNDRLWDEVDALLERIWATNEYVSLEDEAKIDDEMNSAILKSEIERYEDLYGESDSRE